MSVQSSSNSAKQGGSESQSFSLSRLLVTLVLVGVAAFAAYRYGISTVEKPGEQAALKIYGLDDRTENRLLEGFVDLNGDFVADTPNEPARQLDPDVLIFSYLATDQDHYREIWASFLAKLGDQAGKTVEFRAFESAEDQLRALSKGELHVAGLNAGAVPFAVNVCGFVPVCSLGDKEKLSKYTMHLISQGESRIREVSDIKDERLTLTNPTSNSGWKAPLSILLEEFDMQPIRDFDVVYSNGHAESIKGIANEEYQVAAVASDELALAIDRGVIREDQFKIIYTSKPFCNNVIGCSHRLKPELATAIREGLLSIPWEETNLADEFAAVGASQFVAVSFQDDLALIRKIDEVTGRRHSAEFLDPPKQDPPEPPPAEESEEESTVEEEAETAGGA